MKLTELSDPDTVHKNILRLAAARAASDYELGVWLAAAHRLELWKALGIASFVEYARRYLGVKPRPAKERLRVALALESLPRLAEALREGRIHYSKVRELTRIATDETEEAWLSAAAGKDAREIESLVSCHQPGDTPETPPTPPVSARLTFEVSVSTKALVAEARERMIAARGASVSDDELLLALATAALGSPARDEGLSSYQIAITVCDACKTVRQRAGGEDVVVDATVLEQARCDATELGRVDVADPPKATQTVPPRIRRMVMARQGHRCAVPGCTNSAFRHLHHTVRRADGGTHDPELMCGLCTQHHQATHVGTLVIRGTYSSGFVFEHADGEPYGSRNVSPKRSQVLAAALDALVKTGFKQREAQAMIDRVATHVGPDATFQEVVRAALEAAPMPRCGVVREERAVYERIAA